MKVKVKEGITGFYGELDGAIYYYHPRLRRTLMRRKPQMPSQPQNGRYAVIARQLKSLALSPAYRYDFKIYASQLRDLGKAPGVPSWYSLFVKMMWAMQKKYPQQVNLETITRADIQAHDLPCRSVSTAVQDGLLEPVANWQLLNKEL